MQKSACTISFYEEADFAISCLASRRWKQAVSAWGGSECGKSVVSLREVGGGLVPGGRAITYFIFILWLSCA